MNHRNLIYPFLLLLLLTACKSEGELAEEARVARLDSAWTLHEAQLIRVFAAMDKMKTSLDHVVDVTPNEAHLLKGEAGEAWQILIQKKGGGTWAGEDGPFKPTRQFMTRKTVASIFYDRYFWQKDQRSFFNSWPGLSGPHLNHLYDRLNSGNWDPAFYDGFTNRVTIDTNKIVGEYSEDEFLLETLETIEKLKHIEYLAVFQPHVLKVGEAYEDGFGPGMVLAQVKFWDIDGQEFAGSGWILAEQSERIYTKFAANEEEIQEAIQKDLWENLDLYLVADCPDLVEGCERNFNF